MKFRVVRSCLLGASSSPRSSVGAALTRYRTRLTFLAYVFHPMFPSCAAGSDSGGHALFGGHAVTCLVSLRMDVRFSTDDIHRSRSILDRTIHHRVYPRKPQYIGLEIIWTWLLVPYVMGTCLPGCSPVEILTYLLVFASSSYAFQSGADSTSPRHGTFAALNANSVVTIALSTYAFPAHDGVSAQIRPRRHGLYTALDIAHDHYGMHGRRQHPAARPRGLARAVPAPPGLGRADRSDTGAWAYRAPCVHAWMRV
jgi:hypothetical protein